MSEKIGLKIKATLDTSALDKSLNGLKKGVEIPVRFDAKQFNQMVAQLEKMKKLDGKSMSFSKELKEITEITKQLKLQHSLLERMGKIKPFISDTGGGTTPANPSKPSSSEQTATLKLEREMLSIQKKYYDLKNKSLKSNREEMEIYTRRIHKLDEELTKRKEQITDQKVLNSLRQQENKLKEKYNLESKIQLANTQKLKNEEQIKFQNKLKEFQISKNYEFVDEARLNSLIEKTKTLNGLTTKQVRSEISALNREFSELVSDAKAKRLQSSSKGFTSLFNSMSGVAKFVSLTAASQKLWAELRNGVSHIKDVDEAFINMNMTMTTLTKDSFESMVDKVNEMSISMGAVSSDVLKVAQTFANDSTTLESIMAKLEPSVALMNISGMEPTEVTKSIMSIANSYQMLASDGSNAAEVTEYLGDVMAKVSANMDMDFVDGLEGLISGIGVAGSTMRAAGVDMEWFVAQLGNAMVATGQTADKLGRGMRTITARVMQQKQTLEELGESTEDIELVFANGEKALKQLGITIRDDLSGDLKSFSSIMDELGAQWRDLSDTSKYNIAETLAGKNQMDIFIGMMDSYESATNLVEKAYESQGALMEMNAKYAEGLQGKLNSLNSAKQRLYQSLLNSDVFKTLISGLTDLINGLATLIEKVGALPIVAGGAFAVFNRFGSSIGITVSQLAGMTSGLTLATAKTTLLKVAMSGLQTLGVSLLVSGLALAIKKLIEYSNHAERSKKASEELTRASNSLSEALSGDEAEQIDRLEELLEQNKKLTITYQERAEALAEIESITNNLSSADEEYKAILENQNLTYEEQLGLIRSIRKEKILAQAETLEDKMGLDEKENGSSFWHFNQMNHNLNNIAELEKLIESGKSAEWAGRLMGTESLKKELEKQKIAYQEHYEMLLKYNADVEKLEEAREYGYETDRYTYNLNPFRDTYTSIVQAKQTSDNSNEAKNQADNATQAVKTFEQQLISLSSTFSNLSNDKIKYTAVFKEIDDLVKQVGTDADKQGDIINRFLASFPKYEDAVSDVGDVIKILGEQALIELSSSATQAKQYLDELTEADGYSFSMMDNLLESYPELAGHITDVAYVQDFLNQKIKDAETQSQTVYQNMMAHDTEFFQQKVANSEEYQVWKQAIESSLLAYENMLRQQGRVEEANHYSQKRTMAMKDLENAKTIAQSRATIENSLIRGLTTQWSQYYSQFDVNEIKEMLSYYEENKHKLTGKQAEERAKMAEEMRAYLNFINAFNNPIDIKTPQISAPLVSSGSSSSNSSSSSSSSNKIDDLELEIDRYYELENAIKRVENALSLNKTKQENATAKDKIKLMKEEVELLKEKQRLVEKQRKEMTAEANELKKKLQNNGFKFDSNGQITNYEKRLLELQKKANSYSNDKKEKQIKIVEALVENIERYTELINGSIPSMVEDWADLTNQIKEAQRTQLEYISDIQGKITDALKEELQKRTDAVKSELEKQKELYNQQFEDEDWEDNLKSEQRKLDEIKQQIANLSRDTSLSAQIKLEQLMDEYEAQLEAMNQMIRDKEKENGNLAFDEAIEELDKELEDALSPENLAQMVNQALTKGFIDLGGEIITTENLLTDMLKNSGEAFTALGKTLRSELISGLEVAKGLAKELGTSINGIGFSTNSTRSALSVASAGNQLNSRMLEQVGSLSSVGQQVSQTISVAFGNLLNVEGNLDHTVLSTVESMLETAKHEITYNISRALQTT